MGNFAKIVVSYKNYEKKIRNFIISTALNYVIMRNLCRFIIIRARFKWKQIEPVSSRHARDAGYPGAKSFRKWSGERPTLCILAPKSTETTSAE